VEEETVGTKNLGAFPVGGGGRGRTPDADGVIEAASDKELVELLTEKLGCATYFWPKVFLQEHE
jgi:hypothetical protein